ncbi:MAG: hypothetical protein OXK80_05695 [Bdellovibrionales bacterium]|nr:hypothetical protein [Bdellovibrionales bacterium]
MTDFPMDIVIFNKIVEVFNQTRNYILLLFPLAFFIRIAFGFILLKNDGFTDILKDSLFLFLGLFFFTDILKLTLQIPYFVSSELSLGDWRNINLGEGLFINTIKRIVDWLGIISYWISFGLYVVIVSVLGFFASYVLFFGTMFRAYGVLKVFFILLLTVSLWPLLWYSINFAVYVVAVSDNALANNVIIGGASLAKLFIPIWLISKSTKIPLSQNLKKFSYMGGNFLYKGGEQAYSYIRNCDESILNNPEIQNKTDIETNHKGIEASLSQTENGFDGDFAIKEQEGLQLEKQIELAESSQQIIDQEIKELTAITEENNTFVEEAISQETHNEIGAVQTDSNIQVKQESHQIENYSEQNLTNNQSQELKEYSNISEQSQSKNTEHQIKDHTISHSKEESES